MFIKQLLCFLHIFSSRLFSNKPSITQMILGKIKANQRTPLHVPRFETCWLSWAKTDFQEPLVCFLVVETESREILGKFPRDPSRGLSHFDTNRNVSRSDSSRASVRRDTQVQSPCQRVQLKESQSCVQVAMLASSLSSFSNTCEILGYFWSARHLLQSHKWAVMERLMEGRW